MRYIISLNPRACIFESITSENSNFPKQMSLTVVSRQILKCRQFFRPFTANSTFYNHYSRRALCHSTKKSLNNSKMPSSKAPLVLKYTKVLPEAYPPTKGSKKAAGYDLKSASDVVVPARGKALVDTGLKIELPEGCYGRVAPRSGLAVKNFIDVGAGVIDEDYRGVLKVVLFNHSDSDFEVKSGDRIAQLICEKIYYPDLEEVEELTETLRGEGGFGSTGTN